MNILIYKIKKILLTIIKYAVLPCIVIFLLILYKILKSSFNVDETNMLNYNMGYLSFAGTIIVASVSLYITIMNFHITNLRLDEEKFKSCQPRYNIEVSTNFVAPYFEGNNNKPNSTLLVIQNVSDNIALDVFFNDSFYAKKIDKNESIKIVIPYVKENENRFCANIYKYYFINCEDCIDSIPKDILIQYVDSYNNNVAQYFNLIKVDNQYIYVKRRTERV